MKYKLKCNDCPATCWVGGEFDPDCNALELRITDELEWADEPTDGSCKHEEWEVIEEEVYDDDGY